MSTPGHRWPLVVDFQGVSHAHDGPTYLGYGWVPVTAACGHVVPPQALSRPFDPAEVGACPRCRALVAK